MAACAGEGDSPLWGEAPVEPLDLRAELSATEVPLLEEVALTIDLYVGPELEVEFQPFVPLGFRGSVEAHAPRPLGDGEWRRYIVSLRPTKVGDLEVPPFKVRAGEDGPAASTESWTLVVTSLLDEAGAEVEAPAPLFPVRFDPWPWIVGVLAVVVLIALIWWWRRRRKATEEIDGTPVPAHVKARRALGRLRSSPRSTPAQVESFYVEVSHILRVYLEERYGLHAPERTTEEFLAEIEAGDVLVAEHRMGLRPFLQQCDLVKFAKALPGEDVHNKTLETADQFVEATREDIVREGAA